MKLPSGSSASAILFGTLEQMWSVSDRLGRGLIVRAFLLLLSASIVAALAPLVLKLLIDALEVSEETVQLGSFCLVLVYAFAHWLSRSLKETQAMFYGRADQRVQVQLSDKLFRHVMSLPLRFHLDRQTGALHQTLANGLTGYRIVQHHLVNSILPVVIELVTMGTVLVTIGHTIFLGIIGVSMLSYMVVFRIGAMRVSEPARDASAAHINAGAVFTDSIINYETVKFFNAESQVRERFTAALRKTESRWVKLYMRRMVNGIAVASIFSVSLGLSVYVAVGAVLQGRMSIGEFVLVNAYVIQLTRPLEMIGFAFRDLVQGVAFVEKMAKLLNAAPEQDPASGRSKVAVGCVDLVFHDVSFAYDASRHILQNVSFSIPSGTILAIVGASGSGKSSLIRLLFRMLEPTSGQIFMGGKPLSKIPIAALRNAIAVIPQDTALFNDSIAFNISFGKLDCTDEEIVAAAKLADLHDFILGLPDGYHTKVGERGVKLSGGERQRIAIARAAIKRPEIFVFDEATSSLDSTTERAILKNFAKVATNTTAIVIAHSLSTVVNADEIIVLDHGCIFERGTHDTLIQQDGLYATMWHAQHDGTIRLMGDRTTHAATR